MFTINKILQLPCIDPILRLSPYTVYYIEDQYDEAINGFIIDNYQDIVSAFASRGYGFVYFPLLFQKFSALDDWCSPETGRAWDYILWRDYAELIPGPGYIIPMEGGDRNSLVCRYHNATYIETVPELVERLLGAKPQVARPRSRPFGGKAAVSKIWKKITGEEQEPPQAIPPHSHHSSRPGILHGNIPLPHPDDRDSSKDRNWESYELYDILCPRSFANYYPAPFSLEQIEQVDKMVQEMEKLGIGRQLLIQILSAGQKKEFVRMRVTSSYHIILENLDNSSKEVELPPLHRAIYLLYLYHQEGICIKELPGHQEEIFEIYKKISNGLNTDVQRERVIKATDPIDNRINTIFSFIRRTFDKLLGAPSIANYYSITGARGEKRKIELDRDYVIWEKEL